MHPLLPSSRPPPLSARIGRCVFASWFRHFTHSNWCPHVIQLLLHCFPPHNHIIHHNHACDTLNRPTCHDSSLDWSLKQGCFGAAARLHRPLIVSKLSDDLFVCVACNYIAFWSLELEKFRGVEGGGGGAVRAEGACSRCLAPNSTLVPSFVLASGGMMITVGDGACFVAFCCVYVSE